MSNVTLVNFKTREVIEKQPHEIVGTKEWAYSDVILKELPREHWGPFALKLEKAAKGKFEYLAEFDIHIFDKIAARYGDNQPKGGVIFSPSYSEFTMEGDAALVDTWGRGCVHNQVFSDSKLCGGGYWHKLLSQQETWNNPIPFPADPFRLLYALQKKGITKVILGHTSDAFMWMDKKYKITYNFLKYASKFGIKEITIRTRSDLVAQDEYKALLRYHHETMDQYVKVNMVYWTANDEINRKIEPGAPSVARRVKAWDVLNKAGIDVSMLQETVTFDRIKLGQATGIYVQEYIPAETVPESQLLKLIEGEV